MEKQAADVVATRLREGMDHGDADLVARQCQLLALLGRGSEGLALFLQFVRRRVEDVAALHMSRMSTESRHLHENITGRHTSETGSGMSSELGWASTLRTMAAGSARGAVEGLSACFNAVLTVLREALRLSGTAFSATPSAALDLLEAARSAAEGPLARAVDAFVDGPAVQRLLKDNRRGPHRAISRDRRSGRGD